MTYIESQPMVVLYETQVAAIIIFLLSLVGVCANFTVAFFTSKLPTMNNPFGKLTASQSVAETVLCTTFTVYFAPMMMLDSQWMIANSAQAGFINLICYDICIWSHLFISLNRLVAIVFPLHYEKIFSKRNTQLCIGFSWTVAIITAICLYKLNICDFYYSHQFWAFIFTTSDVCSFISWNIDFYKDISIVLVIGVVDLFTIYNVHSTAKQISISSHMQRQRRKKEVNFLKQACLQGVVFVVELLTYFIYAWKFQTRWVVFSLTTVAWITVHTLDGIIIISFNREFRKLVTTPFRKLCNSTSDRPNDHGITNGGTGTGVTPVSHDVTSGYHPH